MAPPDIKHDRAWRLALVAGDENAMRVLAAWYSIPRRKRREAGSLVAELANVPRVHSVLKRLEIVGLLVDQDNPSDIATVMLEQFTKARLVAPSQRSR